MSLSRKVKALRVTWNMTQKQLADTSHITQATLSRSESGQVKELKSEALKRLAVALGVTVDYLVGATDELTPTDIVQSDPIAQDIFQAYKKLSAVGRAQLKNFVRFLEYEEGMKNEKRVNNEPRRMMISEREFMK